MFENVQQKNSNSVTAPNASTFLLCRIEQYSRQIRQDLDAQIDKRLVRPFWICLASY